MEINVWTYVFTPPGADFSDSDSTKFDWSEMSAEPVDLDNYPVNHEVLGAIVYFTGPFTNTSEIYVTYKIYNHTTGIKIFEMTEVVPTPASQGYEWWNGYKVKFWNGRSSSEIHGPCTIRIEIILSGWLSGSTTLYNNVVSSTKETIDWQANVQDNHNFYLLSLYGKNTNSTIGGFQVSNMNYKSVSTSSASRQDNITTSDVAKNDCLTIIAESYNPSTGQVSGIYDALIQNDVI